MTASLRGDGATGLVELLTTVPKSLKEEEMVFLRRPSLDMSPCDEPSGVGANPSTQQGQRIDAGLRGDGDPAESQGQGLAEVAGHAKQSGAFMCPCRSLG